MTPQSAVKKEKEIFCLSCALVAYIILVVYVLDVLINRMHKIPFSRFDLFLTLAISWLSTFVLGRCIYKLNKILREWKKIVSEKKTEFRCVYNINPNIVNAELVVLIFLSNLLISVVIYEFLLVALKRKKSPVCEFNKEIEDYSQKIQEIRNSLLGATKIASDWNFEIPENVQKYLNESK